MAPNEFVLKSPIWKKSPLSGVDLFVIILNEFFVSSVLRLVIDLLLTSICLFKEFSSETDNTSETLLTNLEGQVGALQEWDSILDSIANRGVDAKFVEELQAMGPSVLADLKQINAMTDEQLNQYVELWNRKNQ